MLVLCTNTMHKLADAITATIAIPFVHIADTTAQAIREHGLEVLVPGEPDRRIVHDVIYEELCVGVVADDSREEYRRIIRGLAERGAEGILCGCTEVDLLVGPEDAGLPEVGETGFEPATARPPAGGIRLSAARFAALEPCRLG